MIQTTFNNFRHFLGTLPMIVEEPFLCNILKLDTSPPIRCLVVGSELENSPSYKILPTWTDWKFRISTSSLRLLKRYFVISSILAESSIRRSSSCIHFFELGRTLTNDVVCLRY
eukprot:TRINITY_DN7862_c0_g2_i2.p1 TRINITY_DN7862_c0_g2~~TRINITY_DN7862_c0_g2_i2.p1  ORF type:complete len:114 (+),score=12.75 TRINITY_DN7862_c0_g2_i2:332-673(+)